uniref:hypothetical protein n=1 Tax=Corynebacterium casei TaxID=160386 RepID=UPI000BF06E69|nr:hypothetical protein [Corynebacterium casei]
MKNYKAFLQINRQGIGIFRSIGDRSVEEMMNDGHSRQAAKKYRAMADLLFGPTDAPDLQREFVALGEKRELSLERLLMIEKHAGKLKKPGAAWALRSELVALEGTYEVVDDYGRECVKVEARREVEEARRAATGSSESIFSKRTARN